MGVWVGVGVWVWVLGVGLSMGMGAGVGLSVGVGVRVRVGVGGCQGVSENIVGMDIDKRYTLTHKQRVIACMCTNVSSPGYINIPAVT